MEQRKQPFIVRAAKIVTVSERGTIDDGAMLIEGGIIRDIAPWEELAQRLSRHAGDELGGAAGGGPVNGGLAGDEPGGAAGVGFISSTQAGGKLGELIGDEPGGGADGGHTRDGLAGLGRLKVIDAGQRVVTPSLIDCHTHLLEFAPAALYPVTRLSHGLAAKALLMNALAGGITALGEQVCGYYRYDLEPAEYREWVRDVPIDVSFSLSSISVGFKEPVHFSALTKSRPLVREQLTDRRVLEFLADGSDYPGENLFINATPANFPAAAVPTAGQIMYAQEELIEIAELFHRRGKKLGAHVGGEEAIRLALKAGIDVLHHAHAITPALIDAAARQNTAIVATPTGGTHEPPNTPAEIAALTRAGVVVAISTDACLPPHPQAVLPAALQAKALLGPEALMGAAHLAMTQLAREGWNENDILALITLNAAKVLGKEHRYGSLRPGCEANFLVAKGVPGLEITDPGEIEQVYVRGELMIDRAVE